MRVVFEGELRGDRGAAGAARRTCILDLNLPCTLACRTCLRAGRPESPRLDVARLLRRVELAAADGVELLRVVVHGGDPLLRPDALVALGEAARAAAGRSGARFEGVVLTPGPLLEEGLARTLRGAGFGEVQVTLDLSPEEHDLAHPLRGGGGSFEPILRALKFGRDGLRVVVRVNAAPGDPRVETLADRLRSEGLFAEPDPIVLLVARPASYAAQARQLLAALELVESERVAGRERPGTVAPQRCLGRIFGAG